jgi:hypothetical protein
MFLFYQFNLRTAAFQTGLEQPRLNKILMKLHISGTIDYVASTHTILIPTAFSHTVIKKPQTLASLFSNPICNEIPRNHAELLSHFLGMVDSAVKKYRGHSRWKMPMAALDRAREESDINGSWKYNEFRDQLTESYKINLRDARGTAEKTHPQHRPLEKRRRKGNEKDQGQRFSLIKEKDVLCPPGKSTNEVGGG